MTAREILHGLLSRDLKLSMRLSGEQILGWREFAAIGEFLFEGDFNKERLTDISIRNRETDGAFLTDDEEAALLHVINGGSIDDQLQKEQATCK